MKTVPLLGLALLAITSFVFAREGGGGSFRGAGMEDAGLRDDAPRLDEDNDNYRISGDAVLQSGEFLGLRTVLNEFVSFVRLGEMKAEGLYTNPRNLMILTYALTGFANFVSIGVQIGGIGAMAPSQRATFWRIPR